MFNTSRICSKNSLLLAVIILFTVNACTTNAVKNEFGIKIEKIDSSSAKIRHVYLTDYDDHMMIRGTLERHPSGRGPIHGHLHISLINPQGKALQEADISYMRKHHTSSTATFSAKLPVKLMPGSIIKITHFSTKTHDSVQVQGIWRESKQ